ncbi:L-lactate dehydrogenase complex protein LldG [Prevotella sp. tc2-28]|uniref:LutC/YkgG family protein n=1 Tax=Prevotella sp. tc2-28 TaxID=1761888 RepID=UPI00089BC84A|nr:LUD domain-containing protein [Prevotella sp. tc2-28]SDZ88581.1 L-lactate dehydrogenase complex protein LldG [Prevotella sp. tc2-28]
MSSKEDILKKYRANIREQFDMPDLSDIRAITYPDPLLQFMNMTKSVGGNAIEVEEGRDVNELIRELYPDAKEIASNLPEITIATRNPDEVGRARDLNGTDVGIIRGEFGVAENACVWIPQQMKEKAVCFISENLVILLKKSEIVNNMHEAYRRIQFNDYGYGTFISGPSKTADIAQVLVMGAQAARSATVLLLPE